MTMTADQTNANDDKNQGAAAVIEAENLLQKAADEKGAKVGLEAGRVKVENIDWPSLLRSSFVVDTHVYGASFEAQIDTEDLGITFKDPEAEKAWKRNVKLGKIGTLPEKVRNQATSLKGKIGQLRDRYAPETQFGHMIRLLPAEPDKARQEGWNFVEWLGQSEKVVKEYEALRDYIVEHWDDEHMAVMRGEYRLIGINTYATLKDANTPDLAPLEEFVEAFVNRRMAKIIHRRDEIKSDMRMVIDIRDNPLASQMAQDQQHAEEVLLSREKVRSERTALAKLEEIKLETQRRDMKDGVKTLLADVRANTNDLLYKTSLAVLKAIQDNGEVPGGTIKGLRSMIDNIQLIAVLPDEQVEAQVAKVRAVLKANSMNSNIRDTQSVMKRICVEAKLVLKELDRSAVSSRDVGVPDTLEGLKRVSGLSRSNDQQRSLDFAPVAPNGTVDTSESHDDDARDF